METDGKQLNFERPVLVLQKFNKEMFWGVPLTSREPTGEFYEKITHEKGVAWAMLTQMKTFSSKRLLRKVGMIPDEAEAIGDPESRLSILSISKKMSCVAVLTPFSSTHGASATSPCTWQTS